MIRQEVVFEGLDELADAFASWPEAVEAAAVEAGREAQPVLVRSIRSVTPVRTGFLRDSVELVRMIGPFHLQAEARAFYAPFVHQRTPFMDLGAAAADNAVAAIYDKAITRVVARIGDG